MATIRTTKFKSSSAISTTETTANRVKLEGAPQAAEEWLGESRAKNRPNGERGRSSIPCWLPFPLRRWEYFEYSIPRWKANGHGVRSRLRSNDKIRNLGNPPFPFSRVQQRGRH